MSDPIKVGFFERGEETNHGYKVTSTITGRSEYHPWKPVG